jgi:hypothetical protein
MSSDEENENGLGADLDDEIPETPVGTRRLIKLKRRNPSTAASTSTSTATTTATSNSTKRNAVLSQDVYAGNGMSYRATNGNVVDGTKKKMLDISKILDKVKNSTNYSGYLSNSSFNNSDSISNYKGVENGWKTGSLFDDEDDDNDNDNDRKRLRNGNGKETKNGNDENNANVVLDPPVKAKAKIKAKTDSTTKRAKSKSKATATHTRTRTLNSKKATKVQVSDADPVDSDHESVNVPALAPAPAVTLELEQEQEQEQEQEENGVIETPVKRKRGPNKAKKSTAAMSTITKKSTAKTLRRSKGMTLVDETPMSSEKATLKKRTAQVLKETKEKAEVEEQPVVKKSKTANTNTKSSTDTKTAVNVKANRTLKGRTRNAVKKDVESSKMKTSKSKSKSNNNSKGKNKAIEESSFSLFEVLDISATERLNKSDSFQSGFFGDFGDGDNDDDDDDDEVFVLESPVMKKRKATAGRKKIVAVKRGVESGIASKRLGVESEKKSDVDSVASEDQGHDDVQIDYGDPFLNDEFEDIHHDNNQEDEHLSIKEEEKRQEKERELMELERITSLKLLKQKAQEEKDRKLQEREEQRRLDKLRKEEEIRQYKEKQRQSQIRKESKAKKLETLRKLKESIKEVITPESVISAETYTIPLRDEDVSNSEIKPRRASLASRGRRMSSIGNGFVAMPHDDIPIEKLHEHIDMSLPDSYKLKQLLVWISKRMLKSMDFIGEPGDDYDVNEDDDEDDEVNEKYKMICQELFEEIVNDLTTGRIDIDWWGSQSDSGQPIAPEQSEEDIENAKKLTFYENEVKKMERELKVWEEIENRPKSLPFENVLQKLEEMKRDEDSTDDSVINSVKLREEDEQLVNDVRLAFERIGKLERLMHRSQKCQEAMSRVRELRNNALADVIREQSMCDPIALLRMLK